MFKIPFFSKNKKFLGIDIGTSSVKVVELSYSKKGIVLENYGERTNKLSEKEFEIGMRKKAFFASEQRVADRVKEILKETKIKAEEAIFSIPDFMSFFTVFTAPPMPKEEIASVVRFEARQHIPLPLQEMALDWSLIENGEEKEASKKGSKILLVAVPNETILKYQKIAEMAGIKVSTIEAEVFSLTRAAIKKEDLSKTVQLIDLGIQSTTITIARNGIVRSTYSINFSVGNAIKQLADTLNVSYNEAEELVKSKGLGDEKIKSLLQSLIDDLVSELNRVSNSYLEHEKKEIEKIIIAGGAALIPGLFEYFSQKVKKEMEIADPFVNIKYSPLLNDLMKEMGPRYSVAVGLALRNIENNKK